MGPHAKDYPSIAIQEQWTEVTARQLLSQANVKGRAPASRLEAEALSGGALLIVSADGTILHASPSARYWSEQDGMEDALGEVVAAFSREHTVFGALVLRGAELQITRLDGRGGVVYHVVVFPSPRPDRLRAEAVLTATQQEVARHAVRGATTREIAQTLDRSETTIRTHLREIYLRLGVHNRVELTRALNHLR